MLPPTKTSKSRKRKRRTHHALTSHHTVACPNCGAAKLPHAACNECGYVRPGLQLRFSDEEE